MNPKLRFIVAHWFHTLRSRTKAAKLPDMTKAIIKAESAEAVATILHDSWLGYGVSDLEGTSFTIAFEKDTSLKTFDDAMKFLRYRITKSGSDREYRMARSPYVVKGTGSDAEFSVSVAGAEAES